MQETYPAVLAGTSEVDVFQIFPFIYSLEAKSPYVAGHSLKVASYSAALARKIGLPSEEIRDIYYGALLHDIGKMNIPDAILDKPGPLTHREFLTIAQHPVFGATYLASLPTLAIYQDIVRHHHERMDGEGYPDGICAEQLPLAVRIVSVCDAFDAMTSNRVYRSALPQSEAVHQLRLGAGTQFDTKLVEVFTASLPETTAVLTYPDGLRQLQQ